MVAWIVWLIVAAVLGVAELVTFTFALGILAVGALVAAGVGALDLGLPFQLLAFIIASAAGLGVVLPIARRHVKQPPLLRTGPAALVGRPAHVLEEVNGRGGRVRIWSAACSNGAEPYSIALTLLSFFPTVTSCDVKILATDIDPNMIAEASAGLYNDAALQPVPADLRLRYFASTRRER